MSEFNRKKIAIALAFASLFGNNTSAVNTSTSKSTSQSEVKIPQTLGAVGVASSRSNQSKGLTTGQKAGIGTAALLTVCAVTGFTILGIKKSKNEKEDEKNNPGKKNKQQKPSEKKEDEKNKKNKNKNKGKYYEDNIKIIKEQSGLSKENIEKLIGLIDDENNSFLDNIGDIWIENDQKWYGDNLTKEIIEKAGLTKGNSWVKDILHFLRGDAKINRIESNDKNDCFFYRDELYCCRLLFFYGNGRVWLEFSDCERADKVSYLI